MAGENLPKIPIDYVTKDYEGFFQMMKDAIPSLTPEWTDTSDSDQGIVILQLLSYGLHVLGYYQDRAVNESFLHTARTKKAILLLCKFLGYEPSKQSPAVGTVMFYKDEDKIEEMVVIPQGTQVSTDPQFGEPVIFETDEPLILEEGMESGEVNVTQGQSVRAEPVGIGNGQPYQKFTLIYPEVLEDTIDLISYENNTEYYWERVENLIDSKPTDRHYVTELNEEGKTDINFGDGIFGMRPPLDAQIRTNYRYGGGVVGNLAVGKINYIYEADLEMDGVDRVINHDKTDGGIDYESLDKAKIIAPKVYRTGGKAVTPTDFEDIAETVAGIARAKCVETFNLLNEVYLYVVTDTFEVPSQALLEKVKSEVDKVRVMNNRLIVLPAKFKEFDLDLKVYVHKGFTGEDVAMELEGHLRNAFAPENFEFGEPVFVSKIIDEAFSVAGVRNIVVNLPEEDIECDIEELPKIVNINIETIGGA